MSCTWKYAAALSVGVLVCRHVFVLIYYFLVTFFLILFLLVTLWNVTRELFCSFDHLRQGEKERWCIYSAEHCRTRHWPTPGSWTKPIKAGYNPAENNSDHLSYLIKVVDVKCAFIHISNKGPKLISVNKNPQAQNKLLTTHQPTPPITI